MKSRISTRGALAVLLVLAGAALAQREKADDSYIPLTPEERKSGSESREGVLKFEVPTPAQWVVTIRPLAPAGKPSEPAPALFLASEMRYAKNATTRRERIIGHGGAITENWIHEGFVFLILGPERVAMVSLQSPPAFVTLPDFAFGDFGYINWVRENQKTGELKLQGLTLDYYFHDPAKPELKPDPQRSIGDKNRTATSLELWVDQATQLPHRMVAWNHEYLFEYNLNQPTDLTLPALIVEQYKSYKEATNPNAQIR